jgi:WD40 repeat protein
VRVDEYLNFSSDTPVFQYCFKEGSSAVKFSSSGSVLAVGSHDNKIYIFDISENSSAITFNLRSTFNKHNSYITHIDFSKNSQFLQSNCGAYELLYCDVSTGKQVTSATAMRDVDWESWTCVLGWPVQGIWPKFADGTDINAVDRSRSGLLLATGDDSGKVKLFKYPCVYKNSKFVDGGRYNL